MRKLIPQRDPLATSDRTIAARPGNGNSATIQPPRRAGFAKALLGWYDQHARVLPWREDRDPYRVWLSEIMLQQTRVAAVLEHYRSFLKKFPTVRKLAQAREATVLAAWSGLGYYRRARMLHAAAKVVVKEHAGVFPRTEAGLRELPGIGRYTAAAIASIAFDEPSAVVDGNVERVIARLRGRRIVGEELWQCSQGLLAQAAESRARPGDFNQAIMELGATICVPGAPKCLLCPVAAWCATRGSLAAGPAKAKQKKRTITYGLARREGQVFMVQRGHAESLMAGMWELPMLPANSDCVDGGAANGDRTDFGGANVDARASGRRPDILQLRHSITVTDYAVRVVAIDAELLASRFESVAEGGKWVPASRLPSLALTGLARKILRRSGVI